MYSSFKFMFNKSLNMLCSIINLKHLKYVKLTIVHILLQNDTIHDLNFFIS